MTVKQTKRYPQGTGGVYVYEGTNKEELEQHLQDALAKIDYMRTPHISQPPHFNGSFWQATITYFGLD